MNTKECAEEIHSLFQFQCAHQSDIPLIRAIIDKVFDGLRGEKDSEIVALKMHIEECINNCCPTKGCNKAYDLVGGNHENDTNTS